MTLEMETAPSAAVSSYGSSDITTTQGHETKIKSTSSNRGQGRGQGGHGGKGGHQGSIGKVVHFNHPAYTASTRLFKVEVDFLARS